MSQCPYANHVEHASAHLARNAVTLHEIRNPNCGGFHWFECGDHFHVAHNSHDIGRACKDNSDHLAAARRMHGLEDKRCGNQDPHEGHEWSRPRAADEKGPRRFRYWCPGPPLVTRGEASERTLQP